MHLRPPNGVIYLDWIWACEKRDIGDLSIVLTEISKRINKIDSWNYVSYYGSRDVDIKRTNIFLGFDLSMPPEMVKTIKDDTMIELLNLGFKDIQVFGVYQWKDIIKIPRKELFSFEQLDELANSSALLETEYMEDSLKIVIEPTENDKETIISVFYCSKRSLTDFERNSISIKLFIPIEKLEYEISNE